jgi:pimeloyl-ACP methyl ester carboxylesterase
MLARSPHLFLPGWAASARLYEPGLPPGWRALDPPGFRFGAGLAENVLWLRRRLEREQRPAVLAGHSMGGAIAVLVAATRPELVDRLVLLSPAGLPLTKPLQASARDFLRQLAGGLYPRAAVVSGALDLVRAPRSALLLARRVRELDLGAEMRRVHTAGIPTVVVGCASDTLVTTAHCRRAASLLGARYREVAGAGGHMWMLHAWPRLRAELAAAG